jgi:hypothetical protein
MFVEERDSSTRTYSPIDKARKYSETDSHRTFSTWVVADCIFWLHNATVVIGLDPIILGSCYMASPVRIKDSLYKEAKIRASVEHRSTAEQVSYWASLGKACEDNPDLPFLFVKDLLTSQAEADSGLLEEFEFGH